MTTSISGYTAYESIHTLTPRFFQSTSVIEKQVRPSSSCCERTTPPTDFATYAKAHAYPNGVVKPSTFAVPETRVMSSEPSISPIISSLSPVLQAAAAQALPPFALYANKIPPIADTRPSTAVAASHHLPGPQQLIESTAPRTLRHGSGNTLAFGSTTKIVPLPVTTTRPLPLVNRQKRPKPPVILTANEYSLRSSGGRYPESSYIPHQQWSNVDPRNVQAYGTAAASYVVDYTFPPRKSQVKKPTPSDSLGPFDIPPGFTSVNPPGRSFIAKKKHGSQEEKRKAGKPSIPVEPISPPGFNGVTLSPELSEEEAIPQLSQEPPTLKAPLPSRRTTQQKKRKEVEPEYDVPPFRLVDLQNSVINVSDVPETAKRPRGRPPGINSKKRRIVEAPLSRDMSEDGSETTADSSETTPRERGKEDSTVERPAICSLNPDHPLYSDRLKRGEITDEVICNKRFARRSDCVRHERIHVNDRPYACTVVGCGKSFIQRSALSVHEKTHTGDQPHLCDVCLKKFSDSASLARHRRVHEEDKPYHCSASDCKQSFTRKLSLSRHFRSRHSDLPVPENLSFVSRTRKQDDGVAVSVAQALRSMRREVDASDTDKDRMSPKRAGGKESMTADGKLVKTFEDTSCDSKEVIIYRQQTLPHETFQDDETVLKSEPKQFMNEQPATTKQKRKYYSATCDSAPRYAKAPRTLSPRYMISPPLSRGFITDAHDAPQQFDIGRTQYDNKKQDKRVRPYVQAAFARDEIAVPFDAIYGIAKPRPPQQNGRNLHRTYMPTAYPVSFTASPNTYNHVPRKPPQPQVFYHPFQTPGLHGPMAMSYPVYPNPPPMAARYINSDEKPVVIESGRSRLMGYRMKPQPEADYPPAPTVSGNMNAGVEHDKTRARPQVSGGTLEATAMDIDQSFTRPPSQEDTSVKRLRPLEIPSTRFWSSAANPGIKVSEVRTSLESSLSKDSAATLVDSPSDSMTVKGANAPEIERGSVVA